MSGRGLRARWAGALAGVLLASLAVPPAGAGEVSAPSASAASRGERIYVQGLNAQGRPLPARRLDAGVLPPALAACVGCHRPSGQGGAEGGVRVPSIAAPDLFAAPGERARPPGPGRASVLKVQPLRMHDRPAYTLETLARALREGVDPAGRPLDAAMPRYDLTTHELDDLVAYLRERASRPVPGVQGRRLAIASVITPEARPAQREAVRRLADWARVTRPGGWALDWQAWELEGPPASWAAQLARRGQAQPVFALVSGAGGAHWGPVEDYCEAQRIACVFPSVDRTEPRSRHYSVRLSEGLDGEVRALIRHLGAASAPGRTLWIVHEDGAAASDMAPLRAALAAMPGRVRWLAGAGAATRLRARAHPDPVLLWGGPGLAAAVLPVLGPGPVWLLASLADPERTPIPAGWRHDVRWMSARATPARRAAGETLNAPLGAMATATGPEAADVQAATFFFGDALARLPGHLDTDAFLERLEVAVDRRPAGAGYDRLSLGPGQRVAAHQALVLAWTDPERGRLDAVERVPTEP